ncbi:MAG: peptidoglycan DD-metalloendopeptidase family protein [Pseudomonadota bacterium]
MEDHRHCSQELIRLRSNRKTKLSTTALFVTGGAFLFMSAVNHAFAEDPLLPKVDGEIIFRKTEPTLPQEDGPSTETLRKLENAEKLKGDNQETLIRLNEEAAETKAKQRDLSLTADDLDEKRKGLVERLIATARAIQVREDELTRTERRLGSLNEERSAIEDKLAGERDVISEVLAALQRIGRNPPPALFVAADDVLLSVRSAIVLSAVLPDLSARANVLVANLKDLQRIRTSLEEEQSRILEQEAALLADQRNLDALIKENQRLKRETQQAMDGEEQRARKLAAQATNLRELIAGIDKEISTTISADSRRRAKVAERLRQARERTAAEAREIRQELAALSPQEAPLQADRNATGPETTADAFALSEGTEGTLIDYGSLNTEISENGDQLSFRAASGSLRAPARGVFLSNFGDRDQTGSVSQGLTIATRARAPVIAPASGNVVFADSFRSFRQLLILDVGNDYHILLAGMERVNVRLGDRVAAGEPVGIMGEPRLAGLPGTVASFGGDTGTQNYSGQTQPLLYVEVRENGRPVNSGTLWEK